MAVAGEVEEDGARLALALGLERLEDGTGDGVVGLRRGDDALGAGELNSSGEGGELRAQNVPKVLAPPSYSPTAVFWLRRAWESAVAIATARRSSPYFVP